MYFRSAGNRRITRWEGDGSSPHCSQQEHSSWRCICHGSWWHQDGWATFLSIWFKSWNHFIDQTPSFVIVFCVRYPCSYFQGIFRGWFRQSCWILRRCCNFGCENKGRDNRYLLTSCNITSLKTRITWLCYLAQNDDFVLLFDSRDKVEGLLGYLVHSFIPIGDCETSPWCWRVCETVSHSRIWERNHEVQKLRRSNYITGTQIFNVVLRSCS